MTVIVIVCGGEETEMKTAAVSELKARLSEYLNRVKAGEGTSGAEFVCLDRNLRESALKEGFNVLP